MIIVETKSAEDDKVLFELDELFGFDKILIEYREDIDGGVFAIRFAAPNGDLLKEWFHNNQIKVINYTGLIGDKMIIKFIDDNDLMLFKLTWNDYIDWQKFDNDNF